MQPMNEYLSDNLFIKTVDHVAQEFFLTDTTGHAAQVDGRAPYMYKTLYVHVIGNNTVLQAPMTPDETVQSWVTRLAVGLQKADRPRDPQAIQTVVRETIAKEVLARNLTRAKSRELSVRDELRAHPMYDADRHDIAHIPAIYQNMPGVIHMVRDPYSGSDVVTAILDRITHAQIRVHMNSIRGIKTP